MEDFLSLVSAPKSILGKNVTLLHWAGATESVVLKNIQDARQALMNGYTSYRINDH